MKKFKNLTVNIGVDDAALIEFLVKVEDHCTVPPFLFSEEVEKMYMPDDKMAHILVNLPEVPQAVLLLYAKRGKLDVINIVPYKHSTPQLTKDQYNQIIDAFDDLIISPLFEGKYEIERSKDVVSIECLIPRSYDFLKRWAFCPGAPDHPFVHSSDLELWFAFLCQLRKTNEHLSSGDLELWLREDCKWPDDVVVDTIIRYETETELLEYYDRHR